VNYLIEINYKNKELYQKLIKIPLNSEIKVLKDLEHNFETLNSKINEIIDKMNKEK
jgi:hypothetical protein